MSDASTVPPAHNAPPAPETASPPVDPPQAPPASIRLDLWPRQMQCLQSPAREILFGGATEGGKSHLIRVALIAWCLEIEGLQCVLIRKKYHDILVNHVEGPSGFKAMLAPLIKAGRVTVTQDGVRFHREGSLISFQHCQDERQFDSAQGVEKHVLVVDEATQISERLIRFFRGWCRMPREMQERLPAHHKGRFPRILYTANPIGPSVGFFRRHFVKAREPFTIEMVEGFSRQYIPSRATDNLSVDLAAHTARLSGIGDLALAKALDEGDWDAPIGDFFPEWDEERHVCEEFAPPKHWFRFGTFDWGTAEPFAAYWWCISDGEPFLRDGSPVRYMGKSQLRDSRAAQLHDGGSYDFGASYLPDKPHIPLLPANGAFDGLKRVWRYSPQRRSGEWIWIRDTDSDRRGFGSDAPTSLRDANGDPAAGPPKSLGDNHRGSEPARDGVRGSSTLASLGPSHLASDSGQQLRNNCPNGSGDESVSGFPNPNPLRPLPNGGALPGEPGGYRRSAGRLADGTFYFPRGSLVAYREWYGADPDQPATGLRMRNEDMATGIRERSDANEQRMVWLTDSLPFQDRGGVTIAETFRNCGINLLLGDTTRIAGWSQLRSRLIGAFVDSNDAKPTPLIFFVRACRAARDYIPTLPRHPAKTEDAAEHGEATHSPDAIRLACMARGRIKAVISPMMDARPLRNELKFSDVIGKIAQIKARVLGSGY